MPVPFSTSWIRSVLAATAAVLAVLIVVGPGGALAQDTTLKPGPKPGWHMWGPGAQWRKDWRHGHMSPRHRHRMQRHWIFMNGNIPARFQNLRNPHGNAEGAINKGQQLYTTNCASCHGTEGLGEGEAGNDLFPSPALLAFLVHMPIAADSYLMWTIAEGGKDLNTAMPAFKDTLNDDELWQIISYMRNGFALP